MLKWLELSKSDFVLLVVSALVLTGLAALALSKI